MTRRYEIEQYQDQDSGWSFSNQLEEFEAARQQMQAYQYQQMQQQMWEQQMYAARDHYIPTENAAPIASGLHLHKIVIAGILTLGLLAGGSAVLKSFGPVRTITNSGIVSQNTPQGSSGCIGCKEPTK